MSDPLLVEAQLAARDKEIKRLTAELAAENEVRNAVARHSSRQDEEIERLTAEVTKLRAAAIHLQTGLEEAADILELNGKGMFDATIKEIRLHIHEAGLTEPVSGRQTSDFSRFIREGTAEEKEEVFGGVIDEASKAQRDAADSSHPIRDASCLDAGCDINGKEPHKPHCDHASDDSRQEKTCLTCGHKWIEDTVWCANCHTPKTVTADSRQEKP